MTKLVENDYKVTISVTFNQEYSFLEYGCYLQDGLSFYKCSNSGGTFNESIGYLFAIPNYGSFTTKAAGQIDEITVVIPSSASTGDKFNIKASYTDANNNALE